MEKVRIFLNFEGHNFMFLLKKVIAYVQMASSSRDLYFFDVNGLLSHFLQEFFEVYVLFLYFFMEIGVVLLK